MHILNFDSFYIVALRKVLIYMLVQTHVHMANTRIKQTLTTHTNTHLPVTKAYAWGGLQGTFSIITTKKSRLLFDNPVTTSLGTY